MGGKKKVAAVEEETAPMLAVERVSDDDDDGADIEVPEDSVYGAVREAGFGTLLLSAAVAGYGVWYAGVKHPKYQKLRRPLSEFPAKRRVDGFHDQRALRARWSAATHAIDVSGYGDAYDAPPEPRVAYGEEEETGAPRRRTTAESLVFKRGRAPGGGGHARLPRVFYESASFGLSISAGRTPGARAAGRNASTASLGAALRNASLSPPPTRVYPWLAELEGGDGDAGAPAVDGFVVQYSLGDLAAWRASSRNRTSAVARAAAPLRALTAGGEYAGWDEAQRSLERIARTLDMLLIVSWTPKSFAEVHEDDDLRHCHILQEIHPVRSGYQHLRESSVVWAI